MASSGCFLPEGSSPHRAEFMQSFQAWVGRLKKLKVPEKSSVKLRLWTLQEVLSAKFDSKGEVVAPEEAGGDEL